MVDLQTHKLQLHPSLNISPSYDATNGNNGTNLITKHNSLVDAVQTAISNNETTTNNFINIYNQTNYNYPLTEPLLEWGSNNIVCYLDSSTGNDTTGSIGNINAKFLTFAGAIAKIAEKKINYNNFVIFFYLNGSFDVATNPIDLSNVIVDINKNSDGSPLTDTDLIVEIRLLNTVSNGNRNWTWTANSNTSTNDVCVIPPHFKKKSEAIYKYKFYINLFSGNLIADSIPFMISDYPEWLLSNLYLNGCAVSNTANNGWCDFYIDGIDYIALAQDSNNSNLPLTFNTSNNQWASLEINNVRQFEIYNASFSNYDEAIYFDSDPSSLMMGNLTFTNSGSDDIFLNNGDRKINLGTVQWSKGIYSKSVFYIPFVFNGNLPTGTVFLMECTNRNFTIQKLITKCSSGSCTFNLSLNGGTVTLSSNSISTAKTIHTLTGSNTALANSDIQLTNITGTATNVSLTLILSAKF